jgi:hypothetical protein
MFEHAVAGARLAERVHLSDDVALIGRNIVREIGDLSGNDETEGCNDKKRRGDGEEDGGDPRDVALRRKLTMGASVKVRRSASASGTNTSWPT